MSGRGRPILEAWEQRLVEQREAVQVTARCAWCPWEHAGTVKDTRERFAAHRRSEHPDVSVKTKRKQHRPFRQFNSETNVDDNIANARAQGAATWAGPE